MISHRPLRKRCLRNSMTSCGNTPSTWVSAPSSVSKNDNGRASVATGVLAEPQRCRRSCVKRAESAHTSSASPQYAQRAGTYRWQRFGSSPTFDSGRELCLGPRRSARRSPHATVGVAPSKFRYSTHQMARGAPALRQPSLAGWWNALGRSFNSGRDMCWGVCEGGRSSRGSPRCASKALPRVERTVLQ